MKIDNGEFLGPQKQLYENTKEIERLKQMTGEWWNTQQVLTTSTTSIAISDTNAPTDTQYGFLIDIVGNLFKITAGDGTNLLLEFYSALGTNSEAPTPSGDNITITNSMTVGFGDILPMLAKEKLTAEDGTKFTLSISGSYGQTGGVAMSTVSTYSFNATPATVNTPSASGLVDIEKTNGGTFWYSTSVRWLKFTDTNGNIRYGLYSTQAYVNPNLSLQFRQMCKNIGDTSVGAGNKYYVDFDIFYYDLADGEYKTSNHIFTSVSTGGSTLGAGNLAGFCMNVVLNTNMVLLGLKVNSIRFFKYATGHTGFDCPDYIDLTLEYPYEE